MADQNINVVITATIRELVDGVNAVNSKLTELVEPINVLKEAFADFSEAFVAAFAIDKIAEWATAVAEAGEKQQQFADSLGISIEQASVWNVVADETNISLDRIGNAYFRYNAALAQATAGMEKQESAFKSLGVALNNADGSAKASEEVFKQLLDAISQHSGPNTIADEITIFGRSIRDVLPALKELADNEDELQRKAIELGVFMSEDMTGGMKKTAESSSDLGLAFKGVGITLFEAFKPAIDDSIHGLTSLVESFNDSIKTGGKLNDVIGAIVVSVDIVVAAIELVIASFRDLWAMAEIVFRNLLLGWDTVSKVMYDAIMLNFDKLKEDWANGWDGMVKVTSDSFDTIKKSGERFAADMKALFSNVTMTSGGFGVNTSGANLEHPQPSAFGGQTKKPDAKAPAVDETKNRAAEIAADKAINDALIKANLDKNLAINAGDKARAEQSLREGIISAQSEMQVLKTTENERYAIQSQSDIASFNNKQRSLNQELALALSQGEKGKAEAIKIRGEIEANEIAFNGKSAANAEKHQNTLERIAADGAAKIIAAQAKATAEQLRIINDGAKQEEGIVKLKVAMGELSEKEATQVLESEAEKRLEAIRAAYDEELRSGLLSAAQREEIEQRKTQAVLRAQAGILQARTQEVTAERRLSDSIVGDFTSSLTEMLTTQETWSQRMVNLLNSLVNTLAGVFDKMAQDFIYRNLFPTQFAQEQSNLRLLAGTQQVQVAQTGTTVAQTHIRSATAIEGDATVGASKVAEGSTHATIELGKTGATVAGAAERSTAEQTSAEEGIGAEIAAAVKSITISAYEAAAGVYASVSSIPFVGWVLAPALAAAALGTVLHFAGAFEEGTDSVPATGLAQVHKGEMIIPSTIAETIRNQGSFALTDAGKSLVQGDSVYDHGGANTNSNAGAGAGAGNAQGGSSDQPVQITNNWNVSAIDAGSVQALFKRNGRQLADVVSNQIRSQPGNVTKQVKSISGPAY